MLARLRLWISLLVLAVVGVAPAWAKDRPMDRDWQTGVTVAPGAQTWTADNFNNKKGLIRDIARSEDKTCLDHFAFLGWSVGHGGTGPIMQATRESYEKAGYTVEQKQGSLATDIIWHVRNDARSAVVLWGAVDGSTIYLSCLTSGTPAPNPEKALYLGILSALGLGCLAGGWWMIRRGRALGRASLTWPSAAGTVKLSEVKSFKTKGGKQFMASVAYNYDVGGTPYFGDKLRFGHYAGALAAAEADAAKYPAGSPVEVRYDPKKPATSVLEAGESGISVLGLVLAITGALFLAIVGLVALIT
jgi:hypothetical protein